MECPVCGKDNTSDKSIITCECGADYCNKNPSIKEDILDDYCEKKELKDRTVYLNKEGKYHRLHGKPAIEYTDGGKEYWVEGKLHREDNLPAVMFKDGTREWWVKGKKIK